MKNFIKNQKVLYKFLSDFREVVRILYNTKTRSRFLWTLRKGDSKLSLDYPLNKDSVVFDVGAYEGNFTEKLHSKFRCNIHAFEPLLEYSTYLKKKFKDDPNVVIHEFGLLDENSELKLSNIDGSSSIFSRPEGALDISVNMKSFSTFIEKESISKIDLMYINIEGSEYRLLRQILDSGFINNIDHLQIQFHNFVNNAEKLRNKIRKDLLKTHKNNFNYPFIWERWDKREN